MSSHTASTEATIPGIPELPEAKMHLVPPGAPVVATVVRNERCTAGRKSAGFVRHIELDISGTPLAGNFLVGQSFGVIPPGADDRGVPHKLRLYSIASPSSGEDGEGRVVATTVKRLIDEHTETGKLLTGVSSNYLCDLKVGDAVRITGPSGKRFLLPKDPSQHDFVFVATGTGIAPFRGMIKELLGRGVSSRIALVMGSPYSSDLLYHEFFVDLAQRHTNFAYLPAVSREAQPDGRPGPYVQDRLFDGTRHDFVRTMLESARGLVYICGVAGMELGIFQALARTLPQASLSQYLGIDPDVMQDIRGWTRRMIHKQVRPTRRVFLEVY